MANEPDPYVLIAARRLLVQGDSSWAQITFEVAVLERYRGRQGFNIIRTDTVGRVRKEGGWSLDFGIGPRDASIHVSLGDLLSILPEEEREHWTQHVRQPEASHYYLQARLHPGSCIDDGEVRQWFDRAGT
jgi:hypothetical protein